MNFRGRPQSKSYRGGCIGTLERASFSLLVLTHTPPLSFQIDEILRDLKEKNVKYADRRRSERFCGHLIAKRKKVPPSDVPVSLALFSQRSPENLVGTVSDSSGSKILGVRDRCRSHDCRSRQA